jgi:glycosyltransferase involved in cell wall biosynthesis
MNVLVIPSWYPHRRNPIEGIFSREHALAIGAMRPDWNVAVSLWGQSETVLRIREPWMWPTVFSWARDRGRNALSRNVVEYRSPALVWSDRLLHGRRDAIVDACLRNWESAQRDIGPIDVIHAFVSYPGGWAAMKLSERTGVPYVISEFMGGPFPFPAYLDDRGSLRDFVAEPLARASVRMGVSPTQIERMEELGVDDVELVPLMVDEDVFSPGSDSVAEPGRFFTVAALIPDKGIGDLLQAAAAVLRDRPMVTFRIRGEGDREPWLAQARNLGIEHHVVFLDRLSAKELADEYRRCAAFVLPSHHEAGATSVIEALACGRPVVSTRCGAPEYLVTPETGLLVDVGAAAPLAAALRVVVDEPNRFDSSAIRADFVHRFSRSVVVGRFEDAYLRATAGVR